MPTVPSVSLPLKVLHEAIGTIASVELESGETFRGRVTKIEDNMNIEMEEVEHTYRNGRGRKIPTVYLRGSNIVFFQLADAIKDSPVVQAMAMATESCGAGTGFGSASRGAGGRGRGRGDGGRGRGGFGSKREREE